MSLIHSLMVRFLRYRHPWRVIGFDEVAELYISNLLRVIANTMVMTLSMVYLYKLGYSLLLIAGYFSLYYLIRAGLSWPLAYVVARVGPKHASLISNLLWVPGLVSLSLVETGGLWALGLFGLLQAMSVTLFVIAYHVNFSKVKHNDHAGKELGTMRALQQFGQAISPVIGGLVAFWFGPQATILLAAAIFLLAAMPLLLTAEPVATRQRITFRGLAWSRIRGGMWAELAIGTDFVASTALWGLFVAIAVFGTATNAVYAQLGFVSSVTFVVALVVARVYGQLIDRHKGDSLLRYAAFGNVVIYGLRPFVTTPLGVVLINILNEMCTSGYVMPFVRGVYAMADELPGYRIVYIAIMEGVVAVGAAICFLAVAVAAWIGASDTQALIVGFVTAAVATPLLFRRRFPNWV